MKSLSAILATLVAQSFLVASLWAQSPGGIGDTDLQLWLRSDMGISASGNNVPVPLWEDQGPLLNHAIQPSPIAQPLLQAKRINGYPALRFNFADRFMEADLSTLNSGDYTVFVVSLRANGNPNSYLMGIDQTTPSPGFSLGYPNATSFNLSQFGSSTSLVSPSYAGANEVPSIVNASKSAASGFFNEIVRSGTNINGSSPLASGVESGVGLIGRGSNGNGFRGHIAEVIVYNRSLSVAETSAIKTYLALKYGLTIDVSDHLYFSNASFNFGTASIAQFNDALLNQTKSKSEEGDAILTLSSPEDLDNGEVLTVGHNNGPVAFGGGAVNCAIARLLRRSWYVEEIGEVGEVRLDFETAALGAINPNETVLIIDKNNNGFQDDAVIHGELFGTTLRFNNVDLRDGDYFTLALGRTRFVAAADGDSTDPIWSTDGSTSGMRSINFCEFTEYIVPVGRTVNMTHSSANMGNLLVDGTFDLNGRDISIKQHLEVNGNLITNGATLSFNGTADQFIEGTSAIHVDDVIYNGSERLVVRSNELAVHGVVYVNDGILRTNNKLRLVSDANGTGMIAELIGNISGDIISERYHPASNNGYVMLGSPIEDITNAELNEDLITTGFPGADYAAYPFNNIRSYDETVPGLRDEGFVGATGMSDNLNVGSGRMIYMASGSQHLSLEGKPAKGDENIPISHTNSGSPEEDGWNLIANPYPCTIDWNDVNWTKTNIDDAIYVYDAATGLYASYVNGIANNGGSNLIAPFQAFWVHANGNTPQIIARESVKAPVAATFKNNNNSPFQLTVRSGNQNDEVSFYWDESASDDFDALLEAQKMMISNTVLGIAALQTNGTQLSIQAFENTGAPLTIPLHLNVGSNGTIIFQSEGIEDMAKGRCVTLVDYLTGEAYPIMSGDEIILEMEAGVYPDRFALEMSASFISEIQHPTCPESSNGAITVENQGGGVISWYDESDLLIASSNMSESTLQNLPQGIYRCEIESNSACGLLVSHMVLSAPSPITLNNEITLPSCSNMADGEISAEITGGAAPFELLWNTADAGNSISSLLPGTYELNIVDANGCIAHASFILESENPIQADFQAPETAELVAGMAVVPFNNSSTNASSYLWSFGEGSFSTEVNPTHVYNELGTYQVILTVSNGNCSISEEKTIIIDSAQSIDNDVFTEEFNVGFTIDGIFVQHKNATFNGIINVYNMLGQKLIPSTPFQSQINLQVPVYNNYVLIDIYSPETGQRTFIKRIR